MVDVDSALEDVEENTLVGRNAGCIAVGGVRGRVWPGMTEYRLVGWQFDCMSWDVVVSWE